MSAFVNGTIIKNGTLDSACAAQLVTQSHPIDPKVPFWFYSVNAHNATCMVLASTAISVRHLLQIVSKRYAVDLQSTPIQHMSLWDGDKHIPHNAILDSFYNEATHYRIKCGESMQ